MDKYQNIGLLVICFGVVSFLWGALSYLTESKYSLGPLSIGVALIYYGVAIKAIKKS